MFQTVKITREFKGKNLLSMPHTYFVVAMERKGDHPNNDAEYRRETAEMMVGYLETVLSDLKFALKSDSEAFGPPR
jgi:hypothetical protein